MTQPEAGLECEMLEDGVLKLTLTGRLDSRTTAGIWREAMQALADARARRVVVEASGIEYCDGTGAALLVELSRRQAARSASLELRGLAEEFQRLIDMAGPAGLDRSAAAPPARVPLVENIGSVALGIWRDLAVLVSYVGEVTVALAAAARHPRRVRWRDALLAAEKAGADGLPVIALIGGIMGLILGFQGIVLTHQFGADVFVADAIAIGLLRELGPLVTAIVLAGRTGSAFAAELGTMKVNEEIDALTTMGLDPVRFLALPKIIAVLVVTPLLTIFFELAGLVGGAVVMLTLGVPTVTYINRIGVSISNGDLLGGLLKAVVFGALVAAIGCLRGLRTKVGPSAVGDSTTSAVVSGMVLLAIADGVFAVVYHYLGV